MKAEASSNCLMPTVQIQMGMLQSPAQRKRREKATPEALQVAARMS